MNIHRDPRAVDGTGNQQPCDNTPLPEILAQVASAYRAGNALRRTALRQLMQDAFGAPEGPGSWDWRLVQDICEAALASVIAEETAPGLADALALERLLPKASHRSETQIALQQFSTPVACAWLATRSLAVDPEDVLLEPSAGTGLLAAHATLRGARLVLNELDQRRAELLGMALGRYVPGGTITAHDGMRIADLLDVEADRVLMNPPFATSQGRTGRGHAEWAAHLASAWSALRPGGRLTAILPAHAFERGAQDPHLPTGAVLRATIALPRTAFQASGTRMPVRLVVLDSAGLVEAGPEDANTDGAGACHACPRTASTLAEADAMIADLAPPDPALIRPELNLPGPSRPSPREVLAPTLATRRRPRSLGLTAAKRRTSPASAQTRKRVGENGSALSATLSPVQISVAPAVATPVSDGLYQPWRPAIAVAGAAAHPTPLVVSGAMAAIRPAMPDVTIRLPEGILAQGLLSDAQAETLVLASAAFARNLPGRYRADSDTGALVAVPADSAQAGAVYRQGFFLGDGTGVGKGRQVAALFLSAEAEGATRGVWVSKSDTLIEDARRDWQALGGDPARIMSQSAWKPADPVTALSGILFTTYATLRQEGRGNAPSRLDQLIAWLGEGFEGVIAFDEAHAMANAQGTKGGEGTRARKGSKQGLAGILLQAALPRARVLYVSATGASAVAALAFAPRLGLWGAAGTPFADSQAFTAAMEAGGVATLEMICRDLARLGLYQARALSFEGVDYAPLEHVLTPRDIAIWDAWAEAFLVLHQNLEAALKATGILDVAGKSRNGAARGAALSAFESMKQRFFGQLLMALKMETLVAAIHADLEAGWAAVVQIISTSEAVLTRAVAAHATEEIAAGEIAVSPADLVMDYVAASFPVTAMQITIGEDGIERAEPMLDEHGRPVVSRAAAGLRDAFLERLGTLPEITGPIDSLIEAFGPDAVAECTGRSQRLLPHPDDSTRRRLVTRPASANAAEAAAFQSGAKRVLIFSEAGGTGRSYHADATAPNQCRRVHYLLEPGWRADLAIQGLGRTHRSNQVTPPVFRPVTTDVKGERRFLSTIARRLDALGALTRGERQTGGQNLFRAEDNLESPEAASALRIFFARLARGETTSISLDRFSEITGLDRILDQDGSLREDLPPMRRFLNRLLALPIAVQNAVFDEFFAIVTARVEAARQAGTLDLGIETLRADGLGVLERQVLARDPASGAETELVTLERQQKTRIEDLDRHAEARARGLVRPFVNQSSGRAALAEAGPMRVHEDGTTEATIRLTRPLGRETLGAEAFDASHWELAGDEVFEAAWAREVAEAPAYRADRLTMVTGLLLPHWHLLPDEDVRVRRARLDDGTVLLGRLVRAREIDLLCQALGTTPPARPPADVLAGLCRGEAHGLGEGRALRRALIAGAHRLELTGALPEDLGWLKARGWWTEIVRHRTRICLALPEAGQPVPEAIEAVLARWPA